MLKKTPMRIVGRKHSSDGESIVQWADAAVVIEPGLDRLLLRVDGGHGPRTTLTFCGETKFGGAVYAVIQTKFRVCERCHGMLLSEVTVHDRSGGDYSAEEACVAYRLPLKRKRCHVCDELDDEEEELVSSVWVSCVSCKSKTLTENTVKGFCLACFEDPYAGRNDDKSK